MTPVMKLQYFCRGYVDSHIRVNIIKTASTEWHQTKTFTTESEVNIFFRLTAAVCM